MPEAELMIAPDIAMADLKQSMRKLDQAMKQAAKKAGEEMEDELEKGIVAGARRGARRAAGALRGGFDKMGGARGIGGGLIAGIGAGAMANLARADEATALIEGTMEASDARTLMGTADQLGIDAGSMQKLWDMAKRSGFDDAKDFADILTNISLKRTEALTGEDETLAQFKDLSGVQLMEEVLGSIAKADPAMQTYFLDKLEAGERLAEMTNFGKQVMALGADTGWLAQQTPEEQAAGMRLLTHERQLQQYTDMKVAQDAERQAALMGAITPEKLDAYMVEQTRITNEQLTRIATYEQNLAAAIPIRENIEKGITAIAGFTGTMAQKLSQIADQPGGMGNSQNWLDLSPTFRPGNKPGG